MIEAPEPYNELSRLNALYALNILDTGPDERFDNITQFAARGFNVPISLITLVDEKRQWFKSAEGLDITETPRAASFCAHAIIEENSLEIENRLFDIYDTHEDLRFHDNPLVQGPPKIRSYLGYVLKSKSMNLGTLCIIDTQPRIFTDSEKYLLMILGAFVEVLLNGNHLLHQH